MRQISHSDGLPSSSVLSLMSSPEGILWIGTIDGLVTFDGRTFFPYDKFHRGHNLSGKVIQGIYSTRETEWVQTSNGLDRIPSLSKPTLSSFPDFRETGKTFVSEDRMKIFCVTHQNRLFYYEEGKSDNFRWIEGIEIPSQGILHATWEGNTIRAYCTDGIRTFNLYKGKVISSHLELKALSGAFPDAKGKMLFLTPDNKLMSYSPATKAQTLIADLSEEVNHRGKITSIARSKSSGDIFVGFLWRGMIRLTPRPNGVPAISDLNIATGVMSVVADSRQPIIWIATDGMGIFKYVETPLKLEAITYTDLHNKITRPIRALYLDDNNTMWIGTKGDGILRISNFSMDSEISPAQTGLLTSANSELLNNEVYAIKRSRRPLIWIGTEEGLNYYSLASNRIEKVAQTAGIAPKGIHDIYEENDSVLWLAASGQGIIRVSLSRGSGAPTITSTKVFSNNNGFSASNFFFSISGDGKGTIYAANRGLGAFKIKNNTMSRIKLDNADSALNDMFYVLPQGNALWLGTGAGIIRKTRKDEKSFTRSSGIHNTTIHALLPSAGNKVCASTNDGIVWIDPDSGSVWSYGSNVGAEITEFCDGAAFTRDNRLFFGGTNGLLAIVMPGGEWKNSVKYPDIMICYLIIGDEYVSLAKYIDTKEGRFEFPADVNTFTLGFTAPDHINGVRYQFYYRLNTDKEWTLAEGDRMLFSHLAPGSYELQMRYVDLTTGYESPVFTRKIKMAAPWFLTLGAKLIYLLIALALIALLIYTLLKRQSRMQKRRLEKIEQRNKEKTYEDKIRFFTTITHEFCTPLTLIYGPCERLLNYPGLDSYERKYVSLIIGNAQRLNSLIQEVIDFGRIESGVQTPEITMVDVSGLAMSIIGQFDELREHNNIKFSSDIEPDIQWPTDQRSFTKIFYNLLSNAYKYTPSYGTIKVSLRVADGQLELKVYNTGKGIRPEDKERIFDSYSILDNLERNATQGLSSRHGLGMATCHAMVKFLKGTINIESEVEKYAEFIVMLPPLPLTPPASSDEEKEEEEPIKLPQGPLMPYEMRAIGKGKHQANAENLPNILVLDDDHDILQLLQEGLVHYNVRTADNPDDALELLRQLPPDLIITDVMMPGMSGIEFTIALRKNEHTSHIPVLMLSAKSSSANKIQGFDAGADAYVTKPFSFAYIDAVINRLISSHGRLRDYFKSGASAFDFYEGKLLSIEDKEFVEKMRKKISESMSNPDLNPEFLANAMNMSVRNLYRKLKDLDFPSPNDYIKGIRMEHAAHLLLTTTLPIQDIIYQSGFNNRSNFYKEFDKRYSMTPRAFREANQPKG